MVWTPLRLYLISTIYYNYKSDLKKNNLYRCFFSKKNSIFAMLTI
jgi:hypothetical protein